MYVQPGIARVDGGGDPAPQAVSNQFKPYLTAPAAAPDSKGFVGPTAAMPINTTGQPTSSQLPTAAQASEASARAGGGYSYSGPVAPESKGSSTPFVDKVLAVPAEFAHQVLGGVARGLASTAGVPSTPTPKLNTKTAANMTKAVAGELTGVAPAARVLTGKSGTLFGSKQFATTADVLSALPLVGPIGKTFAEAGALGKVAKEVGPIQAAGEAAKTVKAATAGKVGAVGTAAMVFTSPAGHAADLAKPITSITQSVDAAKLAKTAAKDLTASKAVQSSVKTAAKDVSFTPKSATKVASETMPNSGAKVIQAAIDASTVSKAKEFKAGTTAPTIVKATDTKDTINKSPINKVNAESSVKPDTGKAHTDKTSTGHVDTVKKTNNNDTKNPSDQVTSNYDDPFKVIYNIRNPYQNERPGPPVEPREPLPPKEKPKEKTKKPKPKFNLKPNKAGKWNPSSII